MPMHPFNTRIWLSMALVGLAHAHQAVFHPAMYCVNGTGPKPNPNNNDPVSPLYMLEYKDYWMHNNNGCGRLPPDPGMYLELPAGQSITVEIATNRAFTTLNPHAQLSDWGDGGIHPDDWNEPDCITNPNLHTHNQSTAAGTAFAISYNSDINDVTLNNSVVFTVRYNTPWKRLTTYDIPAGMPACPEGGCLCIWVWVPRECGEPNIYLQALKCKVIPDSTPPKTIGTPQAPKWCKDDESQCVSGPKQVIIWNQLEGNNIEAPGLNPLSGFPNTPGYNQFCGFKDGAQNDIFVDSTSNAGDNSWHSKRAKRRLGKNGVF